MDNHHEFKPGEWPFGDAVNTGVFATEQVMNGSTVLFVAHDKENGDWQFLHSADLGDEDFADLRYVCLGCVFERHRELTQIANLDFGWEAVRGDAASPWKRTESPPEVE